MKSNTLKLSMVLSLLMICTTLQAQKFPGLDKSPMDAASFPSSYRVAEKKAKVVYSRPQLNGRALADLAPNGKQWRTGANEAVEITFYQDVTVGGQAVKAGTYTLSTIPGADEWTFILSSDLNVWGSYFYNEANDVARAMGTVSTSDESLEAFSMAFDDEGNLHTGWGTTRVKLSITY